MLIGDQDDGAAVEGRRYAIEFRLDSASGVPPYLQLVQQVEHAMRLGYLQQGDQLPTIKDAVERLAINPNTVNKAYRELEHRGLVAARPGQGTFITRTLSRPGLADMKALRKQFLACLQAAADAGLDAAGITAMVELAIQEFLASGSSSAGAGQQGVTTLETA